MKVTVDNLPFNKGEVRKEVAEVCHQAFSTEDGTLRFLFRYAQWNGYFGSGVASLAGKVGRSRKLFREEGRDPFPLSDRSALVASYIFDAARDEFDDSSTNQRDSHRTLGQATVLGAVEFFHPSWLLKVGREAAEKGLSEPMWLRGLYARVAQGYGNGSPDDHAGCFRAIGFHLGSEVLADAEFSIIDEALREKQPGLVEFLKGHTVEISGVNHNCYHWLAIHSGHLDGGGVEADHFEWALQGANFALEYIPKDLRVEAFHQIHQGFRQFAGDHAEFFDRVNNA